MEPDPKVLARHALESFPPVDGDHDAAWRHAQRLLGKAFAKGGAMAHLDEAARQALRADLDTALDRMAPTLQARAQRRGPRFPALSRPPRPAPPDQAELARMIADAFTAPSDGSVQRTRALAARARSLVRARIRHSSAGWIAAWRLRRQASRLIAAEAERCRRER